ncbi:TolB family protein [Metabacillus herbersteinensis]
MNEKQRYGLSNSVSISPNDDRIVFSYFQKDIASIYSAKVDGTNVKRLTFPNEESHMNPIYSPDGSKILFLLYPKKHFSYICLMDADGTNIRPIKNIKQNEIIEGIFSPDGQTIYFIMGNRIFEDRMVDLDIYSIGVDGTNFTRLSNIDSFQMSDLSITSDGKRLLFYSFHQDKEQFYFLNLDSKRIQAFNPEGNFDEQIFSNPKISPDNKWLAFSAVPGNWKRGNFEYELFVMDFQNRKSRQLTHLKSSVEEPSFFHTEQKILFIHDQNWTKSPAKYEIMEINLNGSGLRKIELDLSEF